MRFYGNNEHLEYDIIVNSGASPSRVQLSYRGVEGLRVTEEGDAKRPPSRRTGRGFQGDPDRPRRC